jgi:hypothetical protein
VIHDPEKIEILDGGVRYHPARIQIQTGGVSGRRRHALRHGEPGAEQVLWRVRRAERVRQIEENALSKLRMLSRRQAREVPLEG